MTVPRTSPYRKLHPSLTLLPGSLIIFGYSFTISSKDTTGVTTGSLLTGVKFKKDVIETETVVMRSVTGTVRYIKAEHRQLEKFHLD